MTPADLFAVFGSAEIIAHRGYSAKAPENTLAALELAVGAGADAVEFDLHCTLDGTPVLLHDATLERTTDGGGPVAEYTVDELTARDAGSWFDRSFAGEPLPTLEAALAGPAALVDRIYAEVKDLDRSTDLDRIVEVVRAAGLLERTVFISMDWEALDHIRGAEPAALIGYIVESPERVEEAFSRAEGDSRALLDFDADILLADPTLAKRATDASIPLAVWTVNTPAEASELHRLGVRRITTNEVDDLVAWRDGLDSWLARRPSTA